MASGLFSLNVLRKHWALIPVVGICGSACVMSASYIGYMLVTKPDMSLRPNSWGKEGAPYQKIRPDELRKFLSGPTPIKFDPEIEALKRELGSYKV